jgi:hypothetical protein
MFKRSLPAKDSLAPEELNDLIIVAGQSMRTTIGLQDETYQERILPKKVSDIRDSYLYVNDRSRHFGSVAMFRRVPGGAHMVITAWEGDRDLEPMLKWGVVDQDVGGFRGAQVQEFDGFAKIRTNPYALQRFIILGAMAEAVMVGQGHPS